ncbi:hypothetical protein M8C21_014988, partial [Ambrosia artemisiifolia]
MEMGGLSREDLKYMLTSNVNVSNFVSVKLSGRINYKIWKGQMICLIKSQELLHIIDAKYPFPGDKGVNMIAQYDQLVKGWIFGTMSDHVLHSFVNFDSARKLWKKLESRFGLPIRDSKGVSLNALDGSVRTEDLRYMLALSVNVSDFVSVKLSGHNNYGVWKTLMLYLIESHDLLYIIEGIIGGDYETFRNYNNLVNGWIFSTMNNHVLCDFVHLTFVPYIWRKLESTFRNPPTTNYREGDLWNIRTEDMKYVQASNVNVSNFVSVKLSGHDNYKIWKAQMVCLIESQGLIHITEHKSNVGNPMTKIYNNLVKGWIFGTMNDEVLNDFIHLSTVSYIWRVLESTFANPPVTSEKEDSLGFMFENQLLSDVPEMENADNLRRERLYQAVVEGCWWKAKSILKIHRHAATEAITKDGNTILHLAVEMSQNYFVEKLLEFFKDGKDIETKNHMGRTALHIAALVGNKKAAQLLIKKRKELFLIQDDKEESPLDSALSNLKLNISAYLLKAGQISDLSSFSGYHQQNIVKAICIAISTKQYDLASTLLYKFPALAPANDEILMAITITFPTDIGFRESLIYPSFNEVCQKTDKRGFLLFHSNFWDKCVEDILWVAKKCNNMCWDRLGKFSMILLVPISILYPIYQLIFLLIMVLRLPFSMLYYLMWKVLAAIVPQIKNIEKRKREYKEAKKILSLICQQMGSEPNDGYSEPIFEAVCQGAYEVVDEILYTSPATINCKDEEGHNIIQLAVINRSEKVYNLTHYIIERMESCRTMTDSSMNNLAHLAGKLAPSFVLDRTTGAALQLQRELLWREEVEKFMYPLELMNENSSMETPAMVFTREHQELLKEGEIWMKTTAESCSITAALIVTIVFAAAITVPGGSNQESGIPLHEKKFAFTIFAVFNAFSLFTGATALLLFLSILTARFSERDF